MSPANKRTKSAARKPQGRRPQGQARSASRRPAAPPPRAASNRVKWIAVVVVIAIAIAIILATLGGGSDTKKPARDSLVPEFGRRAAPASLVRSVTSVPTNTLDAVGLGSGELPRTIDDGTPGNPPAILFIGAEFCPYCAAERWSLVNALGRFGTFDNLQVTHSSATDRFPNTETFSFYGAKYTSKYVAFDSIEQATNEPSNGSYKLLQQPSQQQQDLWQKYTSGYPFLYIGKRFVSISAYDPKVLGGKTHAEIAAALADPNSAIAKAAVGTANGITAAICSLTNDQPTQACTVPAITDLEKQLRS